ncbi:MAG TPA: 4Fe-4S binding protein, partial [bacterium]|nr:4Fe-4S binding protein [bacterium]
APLVGVAAGDDPLFAQLRDERVIGPGHRSPQEWLPGAIAVVVWFLPYTQAIRMSNRRAPAMPSTGWLFGRVEGEAINNAVRDGAVRALTAAGARAVAPPRTAAFAVTENRANWSERHAAFIAGLGTFGLSRALLTVRGCAGRIGSVITDSALPPTPRAYRALDEYCTQCRACVARCPAGAITAAGKQHPPCAAFLRQTKEQFAPRYGCGKCQTAVPCECSLPRPLKPGGMPADVAPLRAQTKAPTGR